MKDPILLRRKDLLSLEAARYWKDLLYRVIKIGTELEVAPPKGADRPAFEAAARAALRPSNSLERLGENGVLDAEPEHCGLEVRMIGRHPHFASLQKQYARVIGALQELGARVRQTCGLHFHLLSPGLAEPIPEIVLSNLWNLTRRYAPELKYLTSGGESRAGLCRRRQHNSHLEMIWHSPGVMTMAQIHDKLKSSLTVPEHQNFLNLEHLGFPEGGGVLPFHLEFRFPDADFSPTSVAAKTFLFLAMTIKSVDLSQYGVIHVGKIRPWRRKVDLLNALSNNEGALATSDTSGLTEAMLEELRQGCYELLDLLAPAFERFDDGAAREHHPALAVLLALAEHPVSLLRCAGYGWNEIDDRLAEYADLDDAGVDETDRRLMQRIELGEWSGLASPEAWQWHAARELHLTPQELERRLGRLQGLRRLRWDARQGALVFGS